MGVKVVNNIKLWEQLQAKDMDLAVERMADDVKRLSEVHVPVLNRELKQTAEKSKESTAHYRVWYDRYGDLGYAAYQERGMRADGTHVIRRHTRPSATTHFLENAGNKVKSKAISYLKAAVKDRKLS